MGVSLGSFATDFTNRRIIADAHNERKNFTHKGAFQKSGNQPVNCAMSDFCAGYGA
jgi:hypothetical protein